MYRKANCAIRILQSIFSPVRFKMYYYKSVRYYYIVIIIDTRTWIMSWRQTWRAVKTQYNTQHNNVGCARVLWERLTRWCTSRWDDTIIYNVRTRKRVNGQKEKEKPKWQPNRSIISRRRGKNKTEKKNEKNCRERGFFLLIFFFYRYYVYYTRFRTRYALKDKWRIQKKKE